MVKGLFIMSKSFFDLVYPANVKKEIEQLADIYAPVMTKEEVEQNKSILQDVEVIFSGWGGPTLNQEFLDAAPNLKVMFYAAGTIKTIATEASWKRNIVMTTANYANAIPVAEYTLSQILFSLKNGWSFIRDVRNQKKYPEKPYYHLQGAFGSTVGIISLSTIGRLVNELLQPFDINVLVSSSISDEEAEQLNVKKCTIDEIFEYSDVVSLHTPLLPETRGMIKGSHFASMKTNATFINTARGAIVRESEMIDVLKRRRDITAVLDVTDPEPPSEDSMLYTLPNIVLTPHIAGSEGKECGRLGTYMLEEFKRFLAGETLKWRVTKQQFESMA